MKHILLLSDTHNYIDNKIISYASSVDEIWHAGDIGSIDLLNQLQQHATVRAVWGNIDGQDIRTQIPKVAKFETEGLRVLMTHIGGYPGNYNSNIKVQIIDFKPHIFISGHSHILKVVNDKNLHLLHMNPGAVGKTGFHQKRTMLRFSIEHCVPKNLEVIEFKRW